MLAHVSIDVATNRNLLKAWANCYWMMLIYHKLMLVAYLYCPSQCSGIFLQVLNAISVLQLRQFLSSFAKCSTKMLYANNIGVDNIGNNIALTIDLLRDASHIIL